MLDRDSVMTCLPVRPRSDAACPAAATSQSGRPATSSGASSNSDQDFSSASTFWLNSVPRVASRSLIVASRCLPSASSMAPAWTKIV